MATRRPSWEPRYYVLQGHDAVPATLDEWARCFGTTDRIVAKTRVGQREVSTVFLGLDHRHFGSGPPLIFETMVFDLDGGPEDCWRYSTWREAELGHTHAVKRLQGAVVT